jgi:CubicO group peptidase (beta-lactamase class C family)
MTLRLARFAIVLVVACGSRAQDVARMEQVIQTYTANQRFMGAVLVAKGTEVVLTKGYGSANLEWEVPNSPATKFRLGSITKQFTAASILLLQERGKLNVQDPVKKYMADAPAAWDKITIYHVLTHTSGIPSFTSFPEYAKWEPFATTAAEEVAWFRDKPLDFVPGEKWSYSNSGYVLLGYLIEKITGGSYEKFVRENIFTPLGMKDSGYDSNSAVIARRAAGYTAGKNGLENSGFVNMTIPFSAGALYSTTEDLLKWEQGLFGGKLLSAASLKTMTTPFKNDYACGLGVRTKNGRTVIEHGGGIEGFNTQLTYYPDDKLTVVVLGNVNGAAPGEIAAKLAAWRSGCVPFRDRHLWSPGLPGGAAEARDRDPHGVGEHACRGGKAGARARLGDRSPRAGAGIRWRRRAAERHRRPDLRGTDSRPVGDWWRSCPVISDRAGCVRAAHVACHAGGPGCRVEGRVNPAPVGKSPRCGWLTGGRSATG